MLLFTSLACAFSPTLTLFAKKLSASPLEVGIIFAIPALLGMILRIPTGALSSIIGRKKFLMMGAFAAASASFFLSQSHTVFSLYIAGFIFGFAIFFMPSALSLIHDWVPEKQNIKYLGYYSMISGMGRAIGPLCAGIFIDRTHSFQSVFYLCTALATLSLLLIWRLPEKKSFKEKTNIQTIHLELKKDLQSIRRESQLSFSALIRLSHGLVLGAFLTYFPWYGEEIAGLSITQIGLIQSAFVFSSLATRGLTGLFAKEIHRKFLMQGSTLLAGILLFSITQAFSFSILLCLALGLGLSEGLCHINTIAYISKISGKRLFGAAIGMMGTTVDIGMLGGRFIPGLLLSLIPLSALSFQFSFGALGSVVCLATLMSPLFLREKTPAFFKSADFSGENPVR